MPTHSSAREIHASSGSWYKALNGYHWWVLIVASLGWLFDTMDAEALVSACPWCKNNFTHAVREGGDTLKVLDISEVILASI